MNLDAEREYHALRHGAVLLDRPEFETVTVEGDDASRFVHGLTTGEIAQLPEGGVLYTLVPDDRGRVLSDACVWRESERRIVLLCETGFARRVFEWFEAHRIADRVLVSFSDEASHLVLRGPLWRDLLEEAGAKPAPHAGRSARWPAPPGGRQAVVLVSAPDSALLRFEASALAGLRDGLLDAGFALCGEAASERARIEDGRARAGFEFDGDVLPMEIGLEQAVSFTKGCYVGQEIIARASHRGQVRRMLAGLRFEGTEPPERKTALEKDGDAAGWITSALIWPGLGIMALACMRREFAAPDATVDVLFPGRKVEARALSIPFRAI